MALKRACREAGVEKLDAGPKGMVLGFRKNEFNNPGGLIAWINTRNATVKIRPDHKLVVTRDTTPTTRLRLAHDVLTSLTKLANLQNAA